MTEAAGPDGCHAANVLAALFAGGLYGLGGTINQIFAGQGLSIVALTVAQYFCAAVMLGVVVAVRYRAAVSGDNIVRLFGLGALMSGSSITYYLAIDALTVGQGVAAEFQYVWMAVVLQVVIGKRSMSVRTACSLAVLIVGSLMGSGVADEVMGSGAVSVTPQGIALGFASAAFYAVFLVVNGSVAKDVPALKRTFYMAIAGGVVLLAFSQIVEPGFGQFFRVLGPGVVQGLCMVVGPLTLFAVAARSLSGGTIAILAAVELPVAVVTGHAVLGAPVSALMAVGVVLICAGVGLSSTR